MAAEDSFKWPLPYHLTSLYELAPYFVYGFGFADTSSDGPPELCGLYALARSIRAVQTFGPNLQPGVLPKTLDWYISTLQEVLEDKNTWEDAVEAWLASHNTVSARPGTNLRATRSPAETGTLRARLLTTIWLIRDQLDILFHLWCRRMRLNYRLGVVFNKEQRNGKLVSFSSIAESENKGPVVWVQAFDFTHWHPLEQDGYENPINQRLRAADLIDLALALDTAIVLKDYNNIDFYNRSHNIPQGVFVIQLDPDRLTSPEMVKVGRIVNNEPEEFYIPRINLRRVIRVAGPPRGRRGNGVQPHGDEQPGDGRPGDRQPRGRLPRGRQPGGRQPGGRQPGERQPEGRQPGERQPRDGLTGDGPTRPPRAGHQIKTEDEVKTEDEYMTEVEVKIEPGNGGQDGAGNEGQGNAIVPPGQEELIMYYTLAARTHKRRNHRGREVTLTNTPRRKLTYGKHQLMLHVLPAVAGDPRERILVRDVHGREGLIQRNHLSAPIRNPWGVPQRIRDGPIDGQRRSYIGRPPVKHRHLQIELARRGLNGFGTYDQLRSRLIVDDIDTLARRATGAKLNISYARLEPEGEYPFNATLFIGRGDLNPLPVTGPRTEQPNNDGHYVRILNSNSEDDTSVVMNIRRRRGKFNSSHLETVYDPWRIRIPGPPSPVPSPGFDFHQLGFEGDALGELGDDAAYDDIKLQEPGENVGRWLRRWEP